MESEADAVASTVPADFKLIEEEAENLALTETDVPASARVKDSVGDNHFNEYKPVKSGRIKSSVWALPSPLFNSNPNLTIGLPAGTLK